MTDPNETIGPDAARKAGAVTSSGRHTEIALEKIAAKTVEGAAAAVAAPRESFAAGARRWAMSGALLAVGYFCALQKWPWFLAVGFGLGGFYMFSPRKTNDMVTWLIAKAKDVIATKKGENAPIEPPSPGG